MWFDRIVPRVPKYLRLLTYLEPIPSLKSQSIPSYYWIHTYFIDVPIYPVAQPSSCCTIIAMLMVYPKYHYRSVSQESLQFITRGVPTTATSHWVLIYLVLHPFLPHCLIRGPFLLSLDESEPYSRPRFNISAKFPGPPDGWVRSLSLYHWSPWGELSNYRVLSYIIHRCNL